MVDSSADLATVPFATVQILPTTNPGSRNRHVGSHAGKAGTGLLQWSQDSTPTRSWKPRLYHVQNTWNGHQAIKRTSLIMPGRGRHLPRSQTRHPEQTAHKTPYHQLADPVAASTSH